MQWLALAPQNVDALRVGMHAHCVLLRARVTGDMWHVTRAQRMDMALSGSRQSTT